MIVFAFAVILLMLSFAVQLCVWRLRLPSRQIRALLLIFFLTPFALGAFFLTVGVTEFLSAADGFRIALMYVACSLAYIILYSAIEEQSPTLAIVSYVAARGVVGCTDAELVARFGRGQEMARRLVLLERSNSIIDGNGAYRLTRDGRRLAQVFELGSRLFGLDSGG